MEWKCELCGSTAGLQEEFTHLQVVRSALQGAMPRLMAKLGGDTDLLVNMRGMAHRYTLCANCASDVRRGQ
jgi:hypothetical protein